MKHRIVHLLKSLYYGKKGEPYDYYGKPTRFKVGTRPARMKYIDSEAWDVRNDILQLKYLKRHFPANGILWDIGACHGEYAVFAATLLDDPRGRIFCFEPDRTAFGVLKENLALNKLDKSVAVYPVVVSDAVGQIKFLDFNGNMNSRMVMGDQTGDNAVLIDSTTLEKLAGELPVPDLIKIDVEGAELRILNATNELLHNKKVTFLVELHPWAYPEYKSEFGALLKRLDSLGRKVYILDDKKTMADQPCYGSIIF